MPLFQKIASFFVKEKYDYTEKGVWEKGSNGLLLEYYPDEEDEPSEVDKRIAQIQKEYLEKKKQQEVKEEQIKGLESFAEWNSRRIANVDAEERRKQARGHIANVQKANSNKLDAAIQGKIERGWFKGNGIRIHPSGQISISIDEISDKRDRVHTAKWKEYELNVRWQEDKAAWKLEAIKHLVDDKKVRTSYTSDLNEIPQMLRSMVNNVKNLN